MTSNEDGSGVQSAFGIKIEEEKKTAKQLWLSIDSIPLEINLISFIPKVFFCLFPIFALLLKFFYWDRLYINHLILVLHNHSFIFIVVSVIFVIYKLFNIINLILILIVLFLISFYLFRSSYIFYHQKKIITFIKFIPLVISYFFLFLLSNLLIARLFYFFPNVFK